jgi:hypothetical protein
VLPAVALAAAILASGSAGATTPTFSTTVNFRIAYQPDCTFTVAIDGGITMASATQTGATIPPGPYQVSISTPLPDGMWNSAVCTQALFSLNGPGISYSAALGTGTGPYGASFPETFQPSSTYTMVDANQPKDVVTFTTAATGSSSSLLPSSPPPPVSTVTTEQTSQSDPVGSAAVVEQGGLAGALSATGVVTLTRHGDAVGSLPAGDYELTVSDDSRHAGFFVERRGAPAQAISGVGFVGRRSVKLDLTAGSWLFFSTPSRVKSFQVSG